MDFQAASTGEPISELSAAESLSQECDQKNLLDRKRLPTEQAGGSAESSSLTHSETTEDRVSAVLDQRGASNLQKGPGNQERATLRRVLSRLLPPTAHLRAVQRTVQTEQKNGLQNLQERRHAPSVSMKQPPFLSHSLQQL